MMLLNDIKNPLVPFANTPYILVLEKVVIKFIFVGKILVSR